MPGPPDQLIERFNLAVDCWTTGLALQRQRLVRMHPHASVCEIEMLLNRWLQERPGAQGGDGPDPAAR